MPIFSKKPDERAAEEKCVSDVETHGLHVKKVLGDDEYPEFAYTVGLFQSFQQPEVIVLGLPLESAHRILNHLADLMRDGLRVDAGVSTDAVLEGFPVTFRTVPADHVRAHFTWDRWYYHPDSFPTVQLVYPDHEGRWPWDPDAAEDFRLQQPILEQSALPGWAVGKT